MLNFALRESAARITVTLPYPTDSLTSELGPFLPLILRSTDHNVTVSSDLVCSTLGQRQCNLSGLTVLGAELRPFTPSRVEHFGKSARGSPPAVEVWPPRRLEWRVSEHMPPGPAVSVGPNPLDR